MKFYTYSDARQQFAKVLIRRRDGSMFFLTPEKRAKSPFDVQGISTEVSTNDIVATLRSERAIIRHDS